MAKAVYVIYGVDELRRDILLGDAGRMTTKLVATKEIITNKYEQVAKSHWGHPIRKK